MKRPIAWISILSLLFAGCEPGEEPNPETDIPAKDLPETDIAKEDRPEQETGAKAASGGKVDVRILDWKQTQDLVASHRGKVVVLDIWSTTCAPCIKEFPHLVELHQKYGGDRLACISVSCDYIGLEEPEALRDEVLAVLRKMGATFQNVLLNVDADTFFDQIDLASIPAVYVYDWDGKVVTRFDSDRFPDGFRYETHVVPLVEKLLAED